ncbi:MAG: histidine kinase dimerization/phospho-acceptor domain-containing protein, partial [Saprospiraceae bacterium]
MKISVFAYLLLLLALPRALSGQNDDPVLDSLSRPLHAGATVYKRAEQCRTVLWYSFVYAPGNYNHWPARLDSLFHCCIANKTEDKRFEKTISAELDFYKGAEEWTNERIEMDSIRLFFESALTKYAALGDSLKMGWSNLQLCYVASALGDSLLFVKHYEDANRLSVLNKIAGDLSTFHKRCGTTSYYFGRYAESASHYFKALELIDKNGDLGQNISKNILLILLGGIYYDIGDFGNAEQYARKALQFAIEEKIEPYQHYNFLAKCLIEKDNYSEALASLKKGEKRVSNLSVSTNLRMQATCYRKLGYLKMALLQAEKAVQLTPMAIDVRFTIPALSELAACEFALGMMDKALNHALESYEAFVSSSNNRGKMQAAELLTNIYKSKGNYRLALKYSELRYQHQQQVERQQSIRQMALGEFARDNAAEKARREAEVKAQLDQQRNMRYALFAGLGVLALLAFLLYNRFRFKQRTNAQLEAKNREVEAARSRAEQERQRAETSEAFKSRFLANMSHEIRTPLHGIAGFTDLLLETSLNEKQRRWLSSIHHSTDRLGEVVNDILDLSKLEAGEVKLRQVPFSPARVAADVQEALSLRAENKGIELSLHICDNVPEALSGDPTRLYQILMNLVGNAVKFTEKGSVTLAIDSMTSSHPVNSANSQAVISSHPVNSANSQAG